MSDGYGDIALSKGLGLFSLALGAAELFASDALAEALGMEGQEPLIRAYGVREIVNGAVVLANLERPEGLWVRAAGDALDVATLLPAMTRDNPKRANVAIAVAAVAGVAVLDVLGALWLGQRQEHRRTVAVRARRRLPEGAAGPGGSPDGRDRYGWEQDFRDEGLRDEGFQPLPHGAYERAA